LNITSSGEEMRDGSIELVVKFKRALENPFRVRTSPVPVTEEFEYKVYPEARGIRSIPRSEFVILEFDMSNDPIPLEAVDLSIQVVYKGRLGAESEAVVVGFSNIGEPTPFDVYNSMDRFCLYSTWYIAGSDAIQDQVDPLGRPITMSADIFSHDLKDIYVRFSFYWTPKAVSPTDYQYHIPLLKAGQYKRVYLLTESYFIVSLYPSKIEHTDPDDNLWMRPIPVMTYEEAAVWNQEGSIPRGWTFRGLDTFANAIILPWPFPATSTCELKNIP
jgi:hypothetical protein